MAQLTIVFGLVECVFGWLQLLGFAASGNLFLAIGLMPALMGRTGWIAALLGCAVVAAGRYVSAGRSFEKGRLRMYAVSVIVLTTAFLALLYFLKPDSAQGRVLMWMVAFKAMSAHPLGVGWDQSCRRFRTGSGRLFRPAS